MMRDSGASVKRPPSCGQKSIDAVQSGLEMWREFSDGEESSSDVAMCVVDVSVSLSEVRVNFFAKGTLGTRRIEKYHPRLARDARPTDATMARDAEDER